MKQTCHAQGVIPIKRADVMWGEVRGIERDISWEISRMRERETGERRDKKGNQKVQDANLGPMFEDHSTNSTNGESWDLRKA